MTKEEIEEKYQELCQTPSDINEHLPKLHEYANKCKHITELGVRGCVSLFAFLASTAEKVVAIDIMDVWVPEVEKLYFKCADDLTIELEETDMLFIDTAHHYDQCKEELRLHSGKVRKYIAFHDTFTFGLNGDNGGEGLLKAIRDFLKDNPQWKQCYHTDRNNGLTILERV